MVVFFGQILTSITGANLRSPGTEFEVETNLRVPLWRMRVAYDFLWVSVMIAYVFME